MTDLQAERAARELLSAGWRPVAERCYVTLADGAPPRLVDYGVWQMMKEIWGAEQRRAGGGRDGQPPT